MPIFVRARRQDRIHQLVKRIVRTGIDRPAAHPLRLLPLQPLHGKLQVRHPQGRTLLSRIYPHRPVPVRTLIAPKRTDIVHIHLFRLPGQQTFLQLLRETVRIRRRAKRLARQNSRRLVIPMSITLGTAKARDDDVRTKCPNHSHNIGQGYIVSLPLLKGLVRILRETEICHSRESLFRAVITVRLRQLQRAQHSQYIEQVTADFILSTFAAIQREQYRGDAFASRLECKQSAILIVGMRGRVQHSGRGVQALQLVFQASRARILGQRPHRIRLLRRTLRDPGQNQGEPKKEQNRDA